MSLDSTVAEAVEDIVGATEEVTEEVILGIVRIEDVAGVGVGDSEDGRYGTSCQVFAAPTIALYA